MLRRKARRVQGADDPLDAAQERRVRAVLALGGVPQADLPEGYSTGSPAVGTRGEGGRGAA